MARAGMRQEVCMARAGMRQEMCMAQTADRPSTASGAQPQARGFCGPRRSTQQLWSMVGADAMAVVVDGWGRRYG